MKSFVLSVFVLLSVCSLSILYALLINLRHRNSLFTIRFPSWSSEDVVPTINERYCANRTFPPSVDCVEALTSLLRGSDVTNATWNRTFDGTSGFLLPALLYGPNNQYHGLKESIALAHMLNRRLVIPPFYTHYTEKDKEMPIIDARHVLDVDRLSSAFGAVSLEVFQRACHRRADVFFLSKPFFGMTAHTMLHRLEHFKQAAQLKNKLFYKFESFNPDVEVRQRHQRIHNVANALDVFGDKRECAVLVFPYMSIDIRSYLYLLGQNMKRPAPVRNLAEQFVAKTFAGESYGCLHWRYDQEWSLVWCSNYWPKPHKKTAADFGLPRACSILDVTVAELAVYLKVKVTKFKLPHLYLASPYLPNSSFVSELKAELPDLLTAADLLKFARTVDVSVKTNSHLSLVEQEICAGSTLFIGSQRSTWSWNLLEERNACPGPRKPRTLWVTEILQITLNANPIKRPVS
eukprot:m.99319 g.99319  ORF g.99319 m.99319 type:complete len:462 (+) comp37063_c0_seq1:104-1489(+)